MSTTTLFLERLGTLIQQSVREDAARHGLLPIHLQVLQYLVQANRYSDLPIAVADYFGITRGTVSQTLGVLERKGLVVKRPDSRDGRRLHIGLTPAGEAVLGESWCERVQNVLSAQADAAELEETLRAILIALQRINGQRAFGVCRECVHFQTGANGARCGLTGESLATEQTEKICREWTEPATTEG